MAGRVKPWKLSGKAVLQAAALMLLLALSPLDCRNPVGGGAELPTITIKIEGNTVGDNYEAAPVRQGEEKTLVVSLLNSGNSELKLTGTPLVQPNNPLFTVTEQPAAVVEAQGSTTFTVSFGAIAPEGSQVCLLTIANNSRDDDFCFSITVPVDATAPTVEAQFPASASTGVATNVLISAQFSEAMDPETVSGASFTVKKLAETDPLPATVSYNAAAATATLNPDANLDPNSNYLVEMTSEVTDLAGFALVPPISWQFSTGAGTDSTPPSVTSTSPAAGATGVAAGANISISFDESLDPTSIGDSTFKLFRAGLEVAATVSYDDGSRTATLDPSAELEPGSMYEAHLSEGIRDIAQNVMAMACDWSFTTAERPTVVARYPGIGATGIPTNTQLNVEFSKPMDSSSITGDTFLLRDNLLALVGGAVSYNAGSRTATFVPSADLKSGVVYSVCLTVGITDDGGMALAATSWSFRTSAGTDSTPPTIIAVAPLDAATGVLLAANVVASFSESMDPDSIDATTFTLHQGTTPVAGTVSYSEADWKATFDPAGLLEATAVYTATLKGAPAGAADAAGNPLAADRSWSFTTEAGDSPPTVVSVTPAAAATGVAVDTTVVVEFSKMMEGTTITAASFKLSRVTAPENPQAVSGAIVYEEETRKATFTPAAPLQHLECYKVECTAAIEDIGGNALAPFASVFTTVAQNKWDSMLWDQGVWGE